MEEVYDQLEFVYSGHEKITKNKIFEICYIIKLMLL
jgi:hypothetical protein